MTKVLSEIECNCNYKEICAKLRKRLEIYNVHLIECICCGDLEEQDDIERWWYCDECKGNICGRCSEYEIEAAILCQPCAFKRQSEIYNCNLCDGMFTALRKCSLCNQYICLACSLYDNRNFGIKCASCRRCAD